MGQLSFRRIATLVTVGALALAAGALGSPVAQAAPTWSTAFPGVTGQVNAIAVDSAGRTYIGGNFTTVNGIAARSVAMWDGTAWNAMGGGLTDGLVTDLALDNTGNLYVGGNFSGAGGVSSRNIIMWDGNSWQAMGSGTNASTGVFDLLWDQNYGLVMAGDYSLTQGGSTYFNLLRWNGSTWSQFGGVSPNTDVRSLAVIPTTGDLVISGQFSNLPNSAIFWARWNGTSWNSFASQPGMYASSMVVDDSGNLYAGGQFTTLSPSNTPLRTIAQWNGTTWTELGAPSTGIVSSPQDVSLMMRGGQLSAGFQGYIAVGFNYVEFGEVQQWDGSAWTSLGGQFDKGVLALAANSTGELLAGGQFTLNGSTPVNRLARWGEPDNRTAPGAPVISSVTPDLTSATIAYIADDSGGSTVTSIQFALDDTTAVDDSTTQVTGSKLLSNLQPGTTYTVFARAVNAIGTGPWSAGAAFTTGTPTPPTPVAAGPPLSVVADARDEAVAASWSPPTSAGSFAVTTYQATASPGGQSCLTGATSCVIDGLSNGVSYTISVRALTGAGWSTSSDPSNAVIPRVDASPSIVITGARDGKRIKVTGRATGIEAGVLLTPHSARGFGAFVAGVPFAHGPDGSVAWGRRASDAAVWRVYVGVPGLRSNTVTIR